MQTKAKKGNTATNKVKSNKTKLEMKQLTIFGNVQKNRKPDIAVGKSDKKHRD